MDIDYLANRVEFTDEVASIIFNEWGRLIPGNRIENTRRRIGMASSRDSIPLCVVCFDEGILTGIYTLMPSDPANTQELSPWLGSVYVKPEYRNMGIGTRLVEHSLEVAKRLGIETLYLHTTRETEAMYSRIGFQFCYKTEVHNEPVSVMSKRT